MLLARMASLTSGKEQRGLAPTVRALADQVTALALRPGDRSTRQEAADAALDVLRRLAGQGVPPHEPFVGAVTAIRLVVTDLIAFTGVDPDHAAAVVRDATGELEIPKPPPIRRPPFFRQE